MTVQLKVPLLRLRADERGTIAILSAALLPVLVGCLAVAVDMGTAYLERRTAQGIVDLAAINASQFPDNAESAAQATLAANGLDNYKVLKVVKGHYAPDKDVLPQSRFVPGIEPYNAVQVELSKDASLAFAAAFTGKRPQYTVRATAGIAGQATFSVGSRLAALRGGIVNAALGALVGAQVNLSVMDYEALIKADVRIDSFFNAVGAKLGLTAVTYDKLLDADISLSVLAAALKETVAQDGDGVTETALEVLQRQLEGATHTLKLRWLFDLGQFAVIQSGEQVNGLAARIDVFSILRTAMVLAGGERLVSIDLALAVPNVTKTTLTIAIGERQQYANLVSVGQPQSIVRTSQLKMRLVTELGGLGVLAGLKLKLPVYVEAAYAQGQLSGIECDASGDDAATVATTPGLVRAAIADVSSKKMATADLFESLPPALIVTSSLLNVRAAADVRVQNAQATDLTFTQADIEDSVIKRAETSSFLSSIATSLLTRLDINVQVGGLSLQIPSLLKGAVADQIAPLAEPLDKALFSILELLGIHLGEADVKMHAIRCSGAALID